MERANLIGLVPLALVIAAGCDGLIDAPAASLLGDAPRASNGPQPSGSPSASMPPATPGPTTPPLPPFVPAPPVLPRLTVEQYRTAVAELLGAPMPAVELDPDTTPFLYSSIGATRTTMSDRLASQIEAAARQMVAAAFTGAGSAAVVGCQPASADDPCVAAFVARFGRRAFRRALTADEVAQYVQVVRSQGEIGKGLRVATTALIQSPWFLYRFERGSGASASRTIVGEEMASRLAFLVWNTGPDDALLDAAARGELDTVAGIRGVLPRMLADPRAARSARSFFREYMGANSFESMHRDPAVYPRWEEGLGESMREELERFVESIVLADGDLRRLFDQRETFVDARLARFYGLPPVSDWTRVRWPDESGRGGILSLAGVLAFTSHENTTSPTRRGVFIRQRLLCETVPAPPPEVVTQLPPETGNNGQVLTVRERLARHREDPQCAGCHSAFDPMGLGLEEFDASGALRTMEAGRPVDNTGQFEGRDFRGARELGTLFAADGRVMRCLARQVFRRATGRLDTPGETRSMSEIASAIEAGRYRWSVLIEAIAVSDAFRVAAPPTEGN